MGWSLAGSMLKSTVVLSPLPQRREVRREHSIATRLISTWEVRVGDNIYWRSGSGWGIYYIIYMYVAQKYSALAFSEPSWIVMGCVTQVLRFEHNNYAFYNLIYVIYLSTFWVFQKDWTSTSTLAQPRATVKGYCQSEDNSSWTMHGNTAHRCWNQYSTKQVSDLQQHLGKGLVWKFTLTAQYAFILLMCTGDV